MVSSRIFLSLVCLVVCVSSVAPGWGLEKYGRPLPAIVKAAPPGPTETAERQWLRGYLLSAAFLDNPSFAARPDNTGLAGLRHMVHLETDLYEPYLQFYTDHNFFSDRRGGWLKLTEWDATVALAGSLQNWSWRLQYERDAPLDRGGVKQIYADALVTYLWPDASQWSWWQLRFPEQNLTGYAGVGWLFHNEDYFARPDNSGRALLRYVAHADLDLYRNILVLFVDTNFFTDRKIANPVRPTELDLLSGLALRYADWELSLIHEADMPLDRGGLIQRYLALQLRYQFEWVRRPAAARP